MRFVTHRTGDGLRLGAVDERDLVHTLPAGLSLGDLLGVSGALTEVGAAALARRSGTVPLAELDLAAPLQPGSVAEASVVDAAVTAEGRAPGPVLTLTALGPVTGPFDDIGVPAGAELATVELRMAAVVGAPGRHLRAGEAEAHIAGYVALEDWTAWEAERVEMARLFGGARGRASATALGSVFVTADELAPRRARGGFAVAGRVRVNDVLAGDDRFDELAWGFAELVSRASHTGWLRPGDLVAANPARSRCSARVPAAGGDIVRSAVDGIGRTRHRIVALEPAAAPAAH
jgi:2-keto-4-pentenoate hydratase/2-oxohepta-3-ene-1,7-dioic acid hydratase in catechol pathway